jgi:Cu(I)/Ag(I) efflux system membrane protein CusA/SilA
MIDRLIDFSARHRFVVVALAVAAAAAGWRSMTRLPLDALPDTGDRQVIVHSTWDRSPDLIDAQVTSPIVSALLGAPRVRSVRGISDYGSSFVYVIFEDDTDSYWARSRTLEALAAVRPRLPEDATTGLGPDASSLGWVFQYALVDPTGAHDLQALRSFQDWYLKYDLRSVPGVAEVATVGGFVRQFQVSVDPNRLRAYGLSIQRVVDALKRGNGDVGGRILESGGSELVVRGLGSARGIEDLEQVLVATANDGTPVRIVDVAHVAVGSAFRRAATDLDGTGETVSGIVIMREGQNALEVIDRVKARLRQVEPSLPSGVKVVPVYDRSELIRRSVDNLTSTILEVMAIVALVILAFLWHAPSTAVPLITLPLAVLIAFVPFELLGVGANIMSLGGVAIAVGALVDAAIVVVEQSHKRLEEWDRAGRVEQPQAVILRAIKQVGRPSFFALLVIAVSFLPVLTLQGEAGRLFRPLAYAKSLAMLVAAVLAVTLDPALRLMFTRVTAFRFRPRWLAGAANAALVGTVHPERAHPVHRWVMRWYEPTVAWTLRNKPALFGIVSVLTLATIPLWSRLGTEFMPPLDEGTLLYMPSTMPGISISEAERLLEVTDRTLARFPEVERVLGKAGRADTATDPAPVSMLETVIVLRPRASWRTVPTWYASWAPGWARSVLRHVTPDRISRDELVRQMDAALTLPGVANAWSMPVRGRLDMLTTGLRTPVGIKIGGSSVAEIERIGSQIASVLPSVKGTRGVFSEQIGRATFLDISWDRQALARAGIMLDEAQAAVQYAIGGDDVTTVLAGRERYTVNVRYPRDLRGDAQALGRVLVTAAGGREHVPIAQLASIRTTSGPAMLRNEDGLLTGYVYIDTSASDVVSYVREANRVLRDRVRWPQGYTVSWTGRYEAIGEARRQLAAIVPLTLLLIFLLLYANTRSLPKTFIVLLAVPFSAIGAIWALYLLGYHVSVAVWVGLIALLGVDAETGVFMLLYLDEAYDRARRDNRLNGPADLEQAVLEGAARRVRPKLMTAATMFFGLLPILWSTGTGSDVMKRIAAPMIGGIVTSFALELIVYPAVYHAWKSRVLFGRLRNETPR